MSERSVWLRAGAAVLLAAGAMAGCMMPGPSQTPNGAGATSATVAISATPPTVKTLRPVSDFGSIGEPKARSMALFQEAGKVIMSPRCLNCHPSADQPLQNDAMKLHVPMVSRGADSFGPVGMRCATCHGSKNFDATPTSSVPGSKNWHLAPKEMAWVGRSLGQICEQIKDPKRNGNKTLAQIVDHMEADELVGWGWAPGAGRTPAVGTQKEFGELIRAWANAGAQCPV